MNLKIRFLCLIFLLISKNIFCEEIGLVLSGGGGKGAYEIGVWKALAEYGIAQRVTVISGTSVGGLNAALFSCENISDCEKLWREIVPNELQSEESLISQDGLEKIIDTIDVSKIQKNIYPKIYVTVVKNRNRILKFLTSEIGSYSHRFLLNEEYDENELKKKLLATSAFPIVMKPVRLRDGNLYSDGGQEFLGGDNTPINPIVENHKSIKKIIVVYLKSMKGTSRYSKLRRLDKNDYNADLLEIIPSSTLGDFVSGTANFDFSKIDSLINLGYSDTISILKENGLYPVSSYWFED